jgi:uncharacterized protein (DUF1800 family)
VIIRMSRGSFLCTLAACLGFMLTGCGGWSSGSSGNSDSAGIPSVPVTSTAAARILDQSTFGPTTASIQHVQQVGFNAFLDEQFNTPATLIPDIPNPNPAQCNLFATQNRNCGQSAWLQIALASNDQLRQRVAYALGQIWVTSTLEIDGRAMTSYLNLLAKDAFTDYRTIMQDVTLSPAMGNYLNMINSNLPANGEIANENYARELMQLFTTGVYLLNEDGSLQSDSSGNPIPVYTEDQIQAFARVFTGWTYANPDGSAPSQFPNRTNNYDSPMAAVESHHDIGAKAILSGVTLPPGQTAAADLQGALDNVFNHANVGPFVCKQMIQHLVSSAPSPAYVERVAKVFADNGSGVRGDMKAVITAILLDQEARANDADTGDSTPAVDGGHLREPILWATAVARALNAQSSNTDLTNHYPYIQLASLIGGVGEAPLESGSVFNFFPPSYMIPETELNAPEFAIENTGTVIPRLSLADRFVNNYNDALAIDLSATSSLGQLASNPGQLVDSLGSTFMHGQMPSAMRSAIVAEISGISDPAQRVRLAVYLVTTSSQYKVIN